MSLKIRRALPWAAALVLAAACVPKAPTRTVRPDVPVAPWTERTVPSQRGTAEYRYLHLDGPAPGAPLLLLLPGGFYDARIYLNTAAFAERFEVIALDWPDGGAAYTGHVGDYGEIAADFLDALGVSKVHLAGVSMGTYAAIELASRKKGIEVEALALFSTVMFGIDEDEVSRRERRSRMALRLDPDRLRGLVEHGVERADYEEAPGLPQRAIFWVRPYSYYRQIFGMTLNQGAARQATREIACPTLVVHGTEDEVMPVEWARLTASVFQDAEYVEEEGGMHSMIYSRGEKIARLVLDFFARRVPPSPD
ncbi:MAG: alpha/beta hydrolase [Proteobacteria bacterium]|jgi:pimeloyl-ACP methyl ester carboxylesterase|nr:alpha/beta hydrolase [Pseudomonadota bacterium]